MTTPRNAFITGASSGIGLALARRLARDGCEVALAARRTDELERVAAEIRKAGGKAHVFALDVTHPRQTVETIQRADDELDGLDLVVANAGSGRQVRGSRLTWEECSPLIATNVTGAVATLTAVLPRMVERGRGQLVGVSSLAQYRGLPKSAGYTASKAFLSTFLESLRVDLRGSGVSVTDVRPGYVRTPMNAKADSLPFVVEVDQAADIIARAIAARTTVVEFPWATATAMRTVSLLPNWLYDRIVGGVMK